MLCGCRGECQPDRHSYPRCARPRSCRRDGGRTLPAVRSPAMGGSRTRVEGARMDRLRESVPARWVIAGIAFPIGGLIAQLTAGAAATVPAAVISGLIAGAIIGGGAGPPPLAPGPTPPGWGPRATTPPPPAPPPPDA